MDTLDEVNGNEHEISFRKTTGKKEEVHMFFATMFH
jgi:hypothetical protein